MSFKDAGSDRSPQMEMQKTKYGSLNNWEVFSQRMVNVTPRFEQTLN